MGRNVSNRKVVRREHNPARSLAPAVVSGHLEHLWVYLSAPVAGAVCAVFLCGAIHGPGGCCRPGGDAKV